MSHLCQVFVGSISLALLAGSLAAEEPDPAQATQDNLIIETILRLENFDLSKSEKAQGAVLRVLRRERGEDRFFQLLDRFRVPELNDDLAQLSVERSGDDVGAKAARALLRQGGGDRLLAVLDGDDREAATRAFAVLGLAGGAEAHDLLTPLVTDDRRTPQERNAAAAALAKDTLGQRRLVGLAEADKLPPEVHFTVASALHASADPAIRAVAERKLPLPSTAGDKPLPPLAELVQRAGDPARGKLVFAGVGTCSKCHIVRDEGKEVGPNLSEIGSKLSKEAILVSILDPSAAISHNYETYTLILDSGLIVNGILVSQTDDAVTIKTEDALTRTFRRDEIEELIKQPISLMPANLQKLLTVEQLIDVAEYLTTLKKS